MFQNLSNPQGILVLTAQRSSQVKVFFKLHLLQVNSVHPYCFPHLCQWCYYDLYNFSSDNGETSVLYVLRSHLIWNASCSTVKDFTSCNLYGHFMWLAYTPSFQPMKLSGRQFCSILKMAQIARQHSIPEFRLWWILHFWMWSKYLLWV